MESKKKKRKEELKAYKLQLRSLKKLYTQIKKHIKEEREKGPEIKEELASQLDNAFAELTVIRKKISSAKAQSKKRKREIDEWKLWYNSIAKINKSVELKKLNEEIAWRGADIATQEKEISQFYTHLLQIEGSIEQIKLRLEALENGPWEGLLKKEPRIKPILSEINRIQKRIDKLQK